MTLRTSKTPTHPHTKPHTARSCTRSAVVVFALWAASCAAQDAHTPELNQTPPPELTPSAKPSRFDARLSTYTYPFEVKTHRIEAQRQQLEMAYMDVVAKSAETKTPVLLLHGKNFSGAYWERTAKDLAKAGHRVVIPDQIGFGKSSKPVAYQYSFATMVQQTAGLLDRLGIERVIVVGHSMGGMVATRFALDQAARTERLVLVNPIGLEDWAHKVPYAPVERVYNALLKRTPEDVRAYMRESYFDGAWKPEYDAIAEIQMEWTVSPDREQLAYVSALTADMIFTQPVVHDFGRVKAQTLLIIGTRDRTALGKGRVSPQARAELGRYDRLGKAARDAIPGATLVELEGIGHMPQVEAYEAYWDALSAFVR